ncbi:hypothetical protein IMZ48_41385 [Candidatus Bathyarchaeota archaeon]|nr:hypothetical protein [Candidatus Bathyarchaeota archaeon]
MIREEREKKTATVLREEREAKTEKSWFFARQLQEQKHSKQIINLFEVKIERCRRKNVARFLFLQLIRSPEGPSGRG